MILSMNVITEIIEAIGVDVEEMDITDAGKVAEVIKSGNYNAVIHCAAWTAVDKAEDEVELCTKVNVDGTRNIANICKELDIPMMYFQLIMYLMVKVKLNGRNMMKDIH